MWRISVCLIVFIVLKACNACAQQTDYDALVQPLDVKARDFSEYLVQLAWMNSPEGKIDLENYKNARDASKNTSMEWMRDLQATFNLNEANLRAADSTSNIFFPRYNFGVNLNLYNILTQGRKNKIGKRDIDIAEQKINQRKLQTRAETLIAYAEYRLSKELLKTRTLVEQESNANFILIQQLYKTDEKTFEDYTTAAGAYYSAQEARIRAETEVLTARYKLESIIGLKWEQIQHPNKED